MPKEKLETELFRIVSIVKKIDDYLYLCEYMESISSKEELNAVKSIPFLGFLLFTFKYVIIIELDKLINDSPSHKLNIPKFLRKIKSADFSSNLILDDETLDDLISDFEKKTKSISIQIEIIRDKHFAHTDRILPRLKLPSTKKIEKTVMFIKDILNQISIYLSGNIIQYQKYDIFDIGNVLKLFAQNIDNFSTFEKIKL